MCVYDKSLNQFMNKVNKDCDEFAWILYDSTCWFARFPGFLFLGGGMFLHSLFVLRTQLFYPFTDQFQSIYRQVTFFNIIYV
jgi:hypothetical protein